MTDTKQYILYRHNTNRFTYVCTYMYIYGVAPRRQGPHTHVLWQDPCLEYHFGFWIRMRMMQMWQIFHFLTFFVSQTFIMTDTKHPHFSSPSSHRYKTTPSLITVSLIHESVALRLWSACSSSFSTTCRLTLTPTRLHLHTYYYTTTHLLVHPLLSNQG